MMCVFECAGCGSWMQEAANHAAAHTATPDFTQGTRGGQAQVYRYFIQVRTRPLPDFGREGGHLWPHRGLLRCCTSPVVIQVWAWPLPDFGREGGHLWPHRGLLRCCTSPVVIQVWAWLLPDFGREGGHLWPHRGLLRCCMLPVVACWCKMVPVTGGCMGVCLPPLLGL
jgi:hypothetical protein